MTKKYLRWLSTVSKKLRDGYDPKHHMWFMLSVPEPSAENPGPCLLMTLSNGHSKVMKRFTSLEEYEAAFGLNVEQRARLQAALDKANDMADVLEEDQRLLHQRRRMAQGAKWVDVSSGEVIAEAERVASDALGE